MKRGKRKFNGRKSLERRLERQRSTPEDKAENRRKFLASLDKKTRVFAASEFAKLGLFQ